MTAEDHLPQDHPGDGHAGEHDNQSNGDTEDLTLSNEGIAGSHGAGNAAAAGNQQRHALAEGADGQTDNEGRQIEIGNQRTVNHTQNAAQHQTDSNGQQHIAAGIDIHQAGRAAYQCQHHVVGNVDAAHHHDEGSAESDDQQIGVLAQDVDHIVQRHEFRRGNGADDKHRRQNGKGAVFAVQLRKTLLLLGSSNSTAVCYFFAHSSVSLLIKW